MVSLLKCSFKLLPPHAVLPTVDKWSLCLICDRQIIFFSDHTWQRGNSVTFSTCPVLLQYSYVWEIALLFLMILNHKKQMWS